MAIVLGNAETTRIWEICSIPATITSTNRLPPPAGTSAVNSPFSLVWTVLLAPDGVVTIIAASATGSSAGLTTVPVIVPPAKATSVVTTRLPSGAATLPLRVEPT